MNVLLTELISKRVLRVRGLPVAFDATPYS